MLEQTILRKTLDTTLARIYDFTEEELDFITNCDINFRMGDELTAEEE